VPLGRQERADLKRFGAGVRRERIARDLTQERVAELADLNIRTLQKIEAGQINILLTTVLRIRRALGSGWNALLGELD
jgi:transcriptional regulator with XRE-family HTH domain